MDTQSGEVEFRPLDRLWDPLLHNWRLAFFSDSDRPSRMIHSTSGTRHLLDIRSDTFQDIAKRFLPLECSEYLTIVLDVQSRDVSIELPRFRLSFFVSSGELESTNLRGMVVDNNQCTGTMIGLRSQLVLRHKDSAFASLPRSRFVLIPRGHIQFSLSPDKNHVRVHIDTCTNSNYRRRVTWDKYEIDSDLGLLVGSVNLTSRLCKIYLHALCSHPLPDPLTGQTGTDHALQELNAAGCFSFQNLTKADVDFLRLIGNLTPHRYYYPQHLRVMQTINWSSKSPALSQHGSFDTAVCKIMEYAKSLSIFAGPKENEVVDLGYECKGDPLLMARATQRNDVYYEGAGKTSTNFDEKHNSRDSPHIADHDSDGTEALNTSRLVYAWPLGLTRHLEPSELLEAFKGWGSMSGPLEGTSLMYTREWLDFNLPVKWISIYNLCRQTGESASKYQLIFSFAALAYSSPSLRKFIPALLAFATIHQSELIEPPPHSSYELQVGFEPLLDQVRIIIRSETNDLDDSPAAHLSRSWNESIEDLRSRRSQHYDKYISRRTKDVMESLMIESHSPHPWSPFQAEDLRWFNTEKIMKTVREYFASCSRNRDLRSFAADVTTRLQAKYRASPLTGNVPRFSFAPRFDICTRQHHSPFTLANLLSLRLYSAPLYCSYKIGTGARINSRPLGEPINTSNLENLISQFRTKNSSTLPQLYSKRLEISRQELHGQQTPVLPNQLPPVNDCLAYRDQCHRRLHTVFSSIRYALVPSTATERILAHAGLWPRIHHRSMLYPLASTSNIDLSPEWAKILTAFAEVFIEYQFSQRLLGYALQLDTEKYFKELDSASFNRQDAARIPDWLLIQVRRSFLDILSSDY